MNGKTKFTLSGVRSDQSLAWSANSIQVTVPILNLLNIVTGHKSIKVPLHGNAAGLPVGGKLDWVGKIVASNNTKCGIAMRSRALA